MRPVSHVSSTDAPHTDAMAAIFSCGVAEGAPIATFSAIVPRTNGIIGDKSVTARRRSRRDVLWKGMSSRKIAIPLLSSNPARQEKRALRISWESPRSRIKEPGAAFRTRDGLPIVS